MCTHYWCSLILTRTHTLHVDARIVRISSKLLRTFCEDLFGRKIDFNFMYVSWTCRQAWEYLATSDEAWLPLSFWSKTGDLSRNFEHRQLNKSMASCWIMFHLEFVFVVTNTMKTVVVTRSPLIHPLILAFTCTWLVAMYPDPLAHWKSDGGEE